jgi:hypothetical protein
MRAELAIATPLRAAVPFARARSARRRIDPFELVVLAAFLAVSVWVLALDLWQVVANGRVWTGTDGFFVIDQLQYLAWIRDASHHVLASNLFVLRPTPSDYFQPAIAISGALSALGVAPWLALLLWKPVAVAGAFGAVRAYAYRSLTRRPERRAALALGLFFGSFTVVYGSVGVIGDLFPGFLSWGYPFGLMALAAMAFALLAYDRARSAGRLSLTPALLGALASSLHPWQGEVLIVVVLGAELISRRGWSRTRARLMLPAVTVLASALPLGYYAILGRFDISWGLARAASKHSFSLWAIALALVPLALPAAFAYRRRPLSFLAVLTRCWPVAALVVYMVSATGISATPLHAFEGITVPLAMLAVESAGRMRWRRRPDGRRAFLPHLPWRRVPSKVLVGSLVIAAVTIPATAYELSIARDFMAPTTGNANFITGDESSALRYLGRDRVAGGVMTRFYLGALVPAQTGRRTFVGNCVWSEPRCTPRAQLVQRLFDGSLSASAARRFVARSGARFVLADCQSGIDLTRSLAPLTVSIHRFGCATVYELDTTGSPAPPLTESPAHAAVRAPRRQQRRAQ